MEERPVQPSKAYSPIFVTPLPIVTEVRLRFLENSLSLILCTSSPNIYSVTCEPKIELRDLLSSLFALTMASELIETDLSPVQL